MKQQVSDHLALNAGLLLWMVHSTDQGIGSKYPWFWQIKVNEVISKNRFRPEPWLQGYIVTRNWNQATAAVVDEIIEKDRRKR